MRIFRLPSPCCPSQGFQAAPVVSRARLNHNKKSNLIYGPALLVSQQGEWAEHLTGDGDCLPGENPVPVGVSWQGSQLTVGQYEFSRLTLVELTSSTAPLDKDRDNHQR